MLFLPLARFLTVLLLKIFASDRLLMALVMMSYFQNIAATVVPTLVDPKRRVRQASQECVAILAAFMGPTKAAPLIRSIELLESHFERGTGVLNAVQARLSRRQLPRITQDGLVEYSLQVPSSGSLASRSSHGRGLSRRGRSESPVHAAKKYGADIEWILAGKYAGIFLEVLR